MAICVTPNSVPVGAEVSGVNLGSGITDDDFQKISAALHEHGVIFLRRQHITHQQLLDFSARLGTLKPSRPEKQFLEEGYPQVERLSNVLDDKGEPIGMIDAGQYWHSDRSYQVTPSGYAVLYAIEVPKNDRGEPLGGTMFVSATHAYDSLPQSVKSRIANMKALHSYLDPTGKGKPPPYKSSTSEQIPPVLQPVVRTHPKTGRRCLFVSEQYAHRIPELPAAESRELLDYLTAHATRPEVTYTHHWQEGDVLVWDDCLVQHHAIPDYRLPQRRMIFRTTVLGTQATGTVVSKEMSL